MPGSHAARRNGSAPVREGTLRALAGVIRPHQWTKNVLVFAPVVAGHRVGDPAALRSAVLAFVAFCLAASSGYLVNDLLDVDRDRAHPSKRYRPVASGALAPSVAWAAAALLVVLALAVGAFAGVPFLVHLAAYWALSVAYTGWARGVAVLDVLVLAALYTVRVFSGSVATGIPVSNWLLAFCAFLFVSLAFLKRASELQRHAGSAGWSGRGYRAGDEVQITALGTSAGNVAVLVLALYVNAEAASSLYDRPRLLWLVCPVLLYWLARAWVLVRRGEIHDDPVVFALKDRASWVAAAVTGAILVAAT